jgi:predicted permease
MRALLRNLRFGARAARKNPGFTLAAIATIALGVGANTAVFTVTNALLLRPFPFHDPEQLVTVTAEEKGADTGGTLLRYEFLRDHNRSFQALAVWTNDNLNLTGNGEPIQVPIARVSSSFFPTLGVKPELGRTFTEEEGRPDGKPVVMLSDALWRGRYHADPGIVGQAVTLNSIACTVVGVLPADVHYPFVGPAEIWTPRYFELSLMTPERLRQGVGYLSMLGRLRHGVSLSQANAELAVLNREYRKQNPDARDADPNLVMIAGRLRDSVVGDLRGKIVMLSWAVAVVLLIACSNVASLLLSRAVARRREIAVRSALGASRGAIVAQLLTESVMLALIAGALGVALGWGATRALTAWGATQLPQDVPIGIDLRVLLFSLSVSLASGVLFGIAPALQLARVNLNAVLRDEGRGSAGGRTRTRTKNALVIGQVSLSLLLLIGAGLLLRSFREVLLTDPGFDAHNVLTMNISLSTLKYAKPAQQIAFFRDVLDRVSALPGVRNAAMSAALPLSYIRSTPVLPEGQPEVPLAQRPFVDIEAISPQWFETMRVPMRGGRDFTGSDDAQAPKVVVVNETFVHRFWPGQNPLRKHVVVGRWPAAEVVGVAADVKNQGLEQETQAQLYLAFPQIPWNNMNLLVRTDVPPQSMMAAVGAQVLAVDSGQPVAKTQTVDDLMDAARVQPRFIAMLVGAFSVTALILALIGIYGVLSYSVAQRRQEFGIRLALGADRARILRMVLHQGLALTAAGIVIGVGAALLLSGLAAAMLYNVSVHDPVTFVLVPAVFLVIALLASYLPARRAMKIEPVEAMR